MTHGNGCSFRERKDVWNISKLPVLRRTEKGDERRKGQRQAVENSRRGKKGPAKGPSKKRGKGGEEEAIGKTTPNTTADDPSSSTGGLTLTDLTAFDQALSNPESTEISIKQTIISIEGVREQEQAMFKGRAKLMEKTISNLKSRLGKQETEERDLK